MKKYPLYLIILLLVSACSSPEKSFDKGNYEAAFSSALKNIKKGKTSRKDHTILNQAFVAIFDDKYINAARYLESDHLEDWEYAFEQYEGILDYYEEGQRYLDSNVDTDVNEVYAKQEALGENLAKNYFEMGDMRLADFYDEPNKIYAQEAFIYFEKTKYYDDDFKDIDLLLDEAYNHGVILILVEADAPFNLAYSWNIDGRFSDVERVSSGFNQILYERYVDNPDCEIEIDFSPLDVIRTANSNTQNFFERIEDGYEIKTDTSGRETRVAKYRTVEGAVTTTTETLTYNWRAVANPRGAGNYCDYFSRSFSASRTDSYETYELSGDRSAIPNNYVRNTNNNIDEGEIIRQLINDIYGQFVSAYF